MTRTKLLSMIMIAPFVLAGCGEQGTATETGGESEDTRQANPEVESAQGEAGIEVNAGAGETLTVAGLAFSTPEGWVQHPPSNSMRLLELHVPNDAGESSVAVFSTAGGSIDDNITRWIAQMQPSAGESLSPQRETMTISGFEVHTVEVSGTYLGMGRQPPEQGTMLRAAIVDLPDQDLFIKMTGPRDHMAGLGEGWRALLGSLRAP